MVLVRHCPVLGVLWDPLWAPCCLHGVREMVRNAICLINFVVFFVVKIIYRRRFTGTVVLLCRYFFIRHNLTSPMLQRGVKFGITIVLRTIAALIKVPFKNTYDP